MQTIELIELIELKDLKDLKDLKGLKGLKIGKFEGFEDLKDLFRSLLGWKGFEDFYNTDLHRLKRSFVDRFKKWAKLFFLLMDIELLDKP